MAGLLRDVMHAFRQLRRSAGFTTTAILMLALGICANSTVFSWINGTLLDPVPGAQHTGALVTVMRGAWNTAPSPPLSYPDYRDLRDRNHTFSGILGYHDDWLTLTGGNSPQRVYIANTSANYFDVLGVKPYLGRFFLAEEEAQPGGVPYVVLSYSLWRTRFAADPSIVGKAIQIVQRPFTVIGVAPKGFIGCKTGIRTDAWLPLAANTDPGGNAWMDHRDATWLNVTGRLRPGVDRAAATQDLETLMRRIVDGYPKEHLGVNTITLDPLWRSPFGANIYLAATLPILLGIAGVVLLLTCANVVTLSVVRLVARRRETAIRQSLGANRVQLMRQMVIEGMMVAAGGGAIALLLTLWTSKTMARFIPPNSSPIALNGFVDQRVIAVVLLLTAGCALMCGALPAWRSSQTAPAEVLKEEAGSVSASGQNRRLLSGLVITQVALSLALLVTSGLFLRTLKNTSEANPGFDRAHVLLSSIEPNSAGYSGAAEKTFQRQLLARLSALPRVSSAALSDWVPLSLTRGSVDAYPEGYVPRPHESMEVRRASVSAGYFDTMKIPLLAGREFTGNDADGAPLVAIVDQTMANHFWPGQQPLGKRVNLYGKAFTVVGVAKNIKHQQMNEPPEPLIYLSFFQGSPAYTVLHVRTEGDPAQLTAPVAYAVHELNPNLAVFDVRTLEESIRMGTMFEQMETLFASAFGILALILAATGMYGVVAYRTQLRTHEIGIRMALGASREDVLRLVVKQGLRLTAYGLAAGLVLSLLLTRSFERLLYGVSAIDPLTMIGVTVLLLVVGVVACSLPAIKAMRINPVSAMREN